VSDAPDDNPYQPPADAATPSLIVRYSPWLALVFAAIGLASFSIDAAGELATRIERMANGLLYYLPGAIAGIVLGIAAIRHRRQVVLAWVAVLAGAAGVVGLVWRVFEMINRAGWLPTGG